MPRPKDNITAGGVGDGVHGLRRFGRARIRMHAHLAEVMPETWLHEGTSGWVERLPSTTVEHSMNDRRNTRSCYMCPLISTLFARRCQKGRVWQRVSPSRNTGHIRSDPCFFSRLGRLW